MKVLHILSELKHSGAEVMLQQAYERFNQHGIESHILSTGTNIGDYASVLQSTGYKIHHIPFRKHPAFFIAVKKLLDREKFPVVHLHTETAFIWYILLLNFSGVKTVVKTFHNVFQFTGYLRWKRALQRKISSRLFHTIQHAIGDSVFDFEKERFGNDCVLVRNWTDTDKFSPPTASERAAARSFYGIHSNDFVILTVGACTPVKNHMAVLAAAKKANDRLKGKVVVLHVGSGPLLREEKLYAMNNAIEKSCRFVGTLDDVRSCLHAADAFVMTSEWEGLPIAGLEAMSAGLPAILYNVYGLKDLLRNDDGGLLIEPGEDRLVDALMLMVNNLEFRLKKGKGARAIILRDYSLEDSVDKLSSLYGARYRKQSIIELVNGVSKNHSYNSPKNNWGLSDSNPTSCRSKSHGD
jgi:glycosyltransferase involved in cell wall biosynthesis